MARGKKTTGERKVARSDVTGRFVKIGYARKHPDTTTVETLEGKKKKKKPLHGDYPGHRRSRKK